MFNPPLPAAAAGAVMASFTGRPGLYLHVPFCETLCPFCPYNKVLLDRTLAGRYFEALGREMDGYLAHAAEPFTSLYIGGGTPTLCLDALEPLVARIPVAGERAIEVLPGHATPENVARLRAMGVNYLSLGVQSFDTAVLAHLKRPNTAAENFRALEATAGEFDCVDVDLIFDAAFGEASVFLQDLEHCFRAGVEQVSTYPLMRFGYTPFGKVRHQPRKEHRVLRQAEALARRHGYERRSVWTFNRRDAANYTSITREFYLGCGAGAGSFTGGLFFLNHFSVPAYIERIADGELPVARLASLSRLKSAAYYLFWQAYTGRVDPGRFGALYPRQRLLRGLLGLLRGAGILRWEDGALVLTPRGYDRYHDLERWVTYHFIEPLWADMMREHAHLRLPPRGLRERFWLHLAGMGGGAPAPGRNP